MTVVSPFRLLGVVTTVALALSACNESDNDSGPNGPPAAPSCATPPLLEKAAFCESYPASPTAQPSECRTPRTVNACRVWIRPPSSQVVRGTGLTRWSSTDPAVNLACLDTPGAEGSSSSVTLRGVVRALSSGADTRGVTIEIFRENDDGSLGAPIGAPVTTVSDDATSRRESLLARCPDGGCTFRGYTFPAVPTETRLVVKTSAFVRAPTDSTPAVTWATVYEYGVYFSAAEAVDGAITYDLTTTESADLGTISAAAGSFAARQDRGMLLGEVHDCADVRLAGASVDIDTAYDGDIAYFGDDETNPLPDAARSGTGTSTLGMFAALNATTGVPIRVSAIGNVNGQLVLLGTHTVQTFKGAVTTLRLRGRRPWQKS